MNEWYEVDLRSRKDGDSVECIYSGGNHDEAYDVVNKWYKDNLPNWNIETPYEKLIDGTDGVFAYCYQLDKDDIRYGVGKIKG